MRKREVAEFFEVTVQAVDNWILNGCPVEKRDRHGRVKEMLIGEVFEWRRQQLNQHPNRQEEAQKLLIKYSNFAIAGALLAYTSWAAGEVGIPQEKALEMMRLLTGKFLSERSDLDDKSLLDMVQAA